MRIFLNLSPAQKMYLHHAFIENNFKPLRLTKSLRLRKSDEKHLVHNEITFRHETKDTSRTA